MENRILSRVCARELTREELLQISGGALYGCPTVSGMSCTVDGDEDCGNDD